MISASEPEVVVVAVVVFMTGGRTTTHSSFGLMNPSNGSCFNELNATFVPIAFISKYKGGSDIYASRSISPILAINS